MTSTPPDSDDVKSFMTLPLKLVQPGMTLEQNVVDQSGRMIIAQGTRLTPMLLSRLQKWNIREVYVPAEEARVALATAQGESGDAMPENKYATRAMLVGDSLSDESVKAMKELEQELDRRFRNVGERPVMKMLRDAALKVLLKHQAKDIPGRR